MPPNPNPFNELTTSLPSSSLLHPFSSSGMKSAGIDVINRKVIDDMKPLQVYETLFNKQAQLTMATECAISILKIDDLITKGKYNNNNHKHKQSSRNK